MLKSINSFIGIAIISLSTSRKIGEAKDYIVDPDIGKIVGVIGERKGIFRKKNKILSLIDVREISPRGLLVDSEDSLVWQKEIVGIDKIIKSKKKLIKAKVYSNSGKYIGRVYDYLIDDFFYIMKLYIYPPFLNILENQLIIPRDYILEVKRGMIIIKDLENKPKEKEERIKAVKTVS